MREGVAPKSIAPTVMHVTEKGRLAAGTRDFVGWFVVDFVGMDGIGWMQAADVEYGRGEEEGDLKRGGGDDDGMREDGGKGLGWVSR